MRYLTCKDRTGLYGATVVTAISARTGLVTITRSLKSIVSRGVGQAIGLWGEPGIGKSHAAAEILHAIPCAHLSLPASTPDAVLIRALEPAANLTIWAETQLERLKQGETLEAQAWADTINAVLTGLAPFILHLEDMHELSPFCLARIEHLAQTVQRARGVGLIVTSRNQPGKPFKNHRLEPLTADSVQIMLERQLGTTLPADGLRWIQDRTQGNPLFAMEFLRYLTRQGILWNDGARWHWRAPADDFMPVTIEALIAHLIQETLHAREYSPLTPDQDALEAVLAARMLLASDLDGQHWRNVSGLDDARFSAASTHLERHGLLRGDDFAHPLYRELTARLIPSEHSQHAARRALEVFEHDPNTAARFIEAAALHPDESRARYQRAAEACQERGQHTQAGRWFALAANHAPDLLERGQLARKAARLLQFTDTPEAIRLNSIALIAQPDDLNIIFDLAGCQAQLGATAEAQRVLEVAPAHLKTSPAWVINLIKLHMTQGAFADTLRVWNEHPELHDNPDALLANAVGFARMMLNDPKGAERIARNALQNPDLSPRIRSQLCSVLGLALEKQDRLAEARQSLDEAVDCARATGRAVVLASALYNRQIVLERLMLFANTMTDLREAVGLYQSAGELQKYASTLTKLGLILTERGEFEQAEHDLLEARDILQHTTDTRFLITCEAHLSKLYLYWQPPHGRHLALKYAQQALNLARHASMHYKLPLALVVASRASTWYGQAERGLALAEEAMQFTVTKEDRAVAERVKGMAFEALGRRHDALQEYRTARANLDDHTRWEVEFEVARLTNDAATGRASLHLLRQHGLMAAVQNALRAWPELEQDHDAITTALVQKSAPVRLEVLGTVRLQRDGQTVTYRGRKRTEILAYLLEARMIGRSDVPTLELLDVFYPNDPEPDARNTLRQQIHLIRSSLGVTSVLSTSNGYALGAIESDAEEFLITHDSNLWRGTYLEGLGDGWQAGVRDMLTLALRSNSETLLNTNPGEAARLAQLLWCMEPFDLDVLRLHLLALHANGEFRAARRVFDEASNRLQLMNEPLPDRLETFLSVMPDVVGSHGISRKG